MQTQVETLDGLQRRITLQLDMAEVETEVDRRLRQLSKSVRIAGFRPGKAPLKIVAQRYGSEIRSEVMGEALQRGFAEAARAHNLNVAGYPRFDRCEGETAYSATFEVFPEIVIGDVSQIKVTRPVVEVTDADVERTLEVLRRQRMHYHAVDREARTTDRVHVDYVGRISGEHFPGGEARDYPVVLGEGRTLKEFEAQLMGMRPGEQKRFEITFPENYFAQALAGKTATFEVTLKSVQEAQLPEVDADFARSLGIHDGDVMKLRQEIAVNLRREAKRRIQAKVKEQVMQGLLAVTPFEVPKTLIALESRVLLERAVNELKARGMREQDIHLKEEVFEPQARRRVALSLLLDTLVRSQNIQAQPDQVRRLVEEFAQSYEEPAEVVAWYYQDANRLREVEALVLEDNVVDWVLQRAQVTDEPLSLEALMGNA